VYPINSGTQEIQSFCKHGGLKLAQEGVPGDLCLSLSPAVLGESSLRSPFFSSPSTCWWVLWWPPGVCSSLLSTMQSIWGRWTSACCHQELPLWTQVRSLGRSQGLGWLSCPSSDGSLPPLTSGSMCAWRISGTWCRCALCAAVALQCVPTDVRVPTRSVCLSARLDAGVHAYFLCVCWGVSASSVPLALSAPTRHPLPCPRLPRIPELPED
jgi:hypothetical protein